MKNSKKTIKSFGYRLHFSNDYFFGDFRDTECRIYPDGSDSWEYILLSNNPRQLGRKIRNFARDLVKPKIFSEAEERNRDELSHSIMHKSIKKALNVCSHLNHHK